MLSSPSTITDYIRNLITMMECLDEPWGIKDLASRHVYMNKAAYRYTNTPTHFDIEGRFDGEFPAEWAELCDDFQEHDRRTQENQQRVTVIETHFWFSSKTLLPFISEKIPIFDANQCCVGTIWNAKPFNTLSPLIYINQKKPSVLVTEFSKSVFTKSELDTIFLLLQRFSNKEIAKRMNVSYKTIDNRIYTLYQKTGTHSFNQFEAYCRHLGLDTYIPPSFTAKGIQFI